MATVNGRATRHIRLKHTLIDDNSVYRCNDCDKYDIGRSHTIDNAADRHAKTYRHTVVVWRTTFIRVETTTGTR